MNIVRNNRGFSLVEMAVVIIITGFIFVPLMAVFVQRDLDQTKSENIENNDRLVSALNFFLRQEGRYPCPADLQLGPNDADFGQEDCDGTEEYKTGAIPTRTLGLPFHQAINAYGWKHMYTVTRSLTKEDEFNGPGVLRITMSNGAPAQNVPFVLVNPGKDGKGSYNLYGQANILTCDGPALDTTNCDENDTFIETSHRSFDSPTDAGYYDDTLSYGFATQSNALWQIQQGNGLEGKLALTNRTLGNVGIGVDHADAQLHIGGQTSLYTGYDGDGGNINIQSTIQVDESLLVQDTILAEEEFEAQNFCIGEYNKDGTQCCAGAWDDTNTCCAAGVYTNENGKKQCKGTHNEDEGDTGNCSLSDLGNYYDGSQCCHRYERDKNNQCCSASDGKYIDEYGTCKGGDETPPIEDSYASCTGGQITDSNGQCCEIADIDHETGNCESSSSPTCTLGIDDSSQCCNPKNDSLCCPIGVYNGGGSCYQYWD